MEASSLTELIREPPSSDRSYVSFPPFRETLNTRGACDSSPQTASSSVAGTPEPAKSITPISRAPSPVPTAANTGSAAFDADYYTRYHACANFGICGGWVVVTGTACGACVQGKAGSVLDGLQGVSSGARSRKSSAGRDEAGVG